MQSSAADGTQVPVAGRTATPNPDRAWLAGARLVWPVLAAAGLAANLMVLPQFTRAQLNPR